MAVGSPHAVRDEGCRFVMEATRNHEPLVASAEGLQELLRLCLQANRVGALEDALRLTADITLRALPTAAKAVRHGRNPAERHTAPTARGALQLAACGIHGIPALETLDRVLRAAFSG